MIEGYNLLRLNSLWDRESCGLDSFSSPSLYKVKSGFVSLDEIGCAETVYLFARIGHTATYHEAEYTQDKSAVSFGVGPISRTVTQRILDDGVVDAGEQFQSIVQPNADDSYSVYSAQSALLTVNDATTTDATDSINDVVLGDVPDYTPDPFPQINGDTVITGSVGFGSDKLDSYTFRATSSGPASFSLTGLSLDLDLLLYDGNGNRIAASGNAGAATEFMDYSLVEGALYFVDVVPFRVAASSYQLVIDFAEPTGETHVVTGTAGNDSLQGSIGSDELRGLAGNDLLTGNGGQDTLRGGGGNDTYIVNAGDLIIESAGNGIDTVKSAVSWTLAANVEKLLLTGHDAVSGTGNAGANTLSGNSAANTLTGYGRADNLLGLAGDDVLLGGKGNDRLTGNVGADAFVFDTKLSATTNKDTITDFTHGVDKLRLDDDVFTALSVGALPTAQFYAAGGATSAQDFDDRIVYNTTTGALYYDADGSGTTNIPIQFAVLTGAPSLTAADFAIVA